MKVRKYRAKRLPQLLGVIDNVQKYTESEWVYGYYAPTYLLEKNGESKNNYAIISDEIVGTLEMLGCGVQSGLPKVYPIIENTLGQSTGFYDKNEKEVFEGDIVLISKTAKAIIMWDDKKLCFVFNYGQDEIPIHLETYSDLEVIGNVFDNPELIGE